LKKFGYGFNKAEPLRRTALMRAKTVMGNDSVLFNMSCGIMLTKKSQEQQKYNTLASDFKWLVKKGKIL
jgi:hypothetical protein